MTESTGDPVIDEIHAIRRKIFAECDNDPVKLIARLIESQKRHPHRVWKRPPDTVLPVSTDVAVPPPTESASASPPAVG